jgi:integrase/recombinase XerD
MLTLYLRKKTEGKWTAQRIKEGRGIRTSQVNGAFFIRPWINGVQKRTPLSSTTFTDARIEANELERAFEAEARGLTVRDLTALENSNRVPLKTVIKGYLEQKKGKAPKTLAQYRLTLEEFAECLDTVRFLDQINVNALRDYKRALEKKGYAGKTVDTRIKIVYFLLKKNGLTVRLPRDEMPTVETERAVPYSEDELKKLFAQMNEEEKLRYNFFLGSACREQEVTYAAWADLDFGKGTYTVRSKPDAGFTVKNHESRTVPLPTSLVDALKERRAKVQGRWIFVNQAGQPDGHFLRKLKATALKAGINCGQCTTVITRGEYDKKGKVEVSCKTAPVCEHIYLHRFRKTCATRWSDHGVPIRTIQHYLGHKSLETTTLYLGIADTEKMRGRINQAFGY